MSSGENTTPLSPAAPGSPVSLKASRETDVLKRRVLAGISVPNASPKGAGPPPGVGFPTLNNRWLHVIVQATGGVVTTWQLWTWDRTSQEWCLDTRLGTNGTVTLLTAGDQNPQRNIIEIAGLDGAYVRVVTTDATVDAWLASSGQIGAG